MVCPKRIGRWLAGVAWLATLAACTPASLPPPDQSGELVVVTRNSPTTYYLNAKSEPVGFEHDLAEQFAASHGWRVRFVLAENLPELFKILRLGQAHIAAAGLTASEERSRVLQFGPTIGLVREWLICRQGAQVPQTLDDMKKLRLEVVAGSSHVDSLQQLRSSHPGLAWVEMSVPSSEELLERVEMGLSDCTVADTDTFDIAHNFHPGLVKAFALGGGQPHAWVLGQRLGMEFSRQVTKYFQEIADNGELSRLRERYFGHVQRLLEADVLGVLEKRGTLLRALAPHFQEAQGETEIDWRLIAAVAYQESQWNVQAVSFTGVRGIMMLTEDTADQLGVKNRLDARESILGGSRYIVSLMAALPDSVPQPDRTWMALAAYNLGMGHLQDARTLAQKLGRNPDAWNDVKEVLPLLGRSKYAAKLRNGFARGGEALAFVENVRIYNDILVKYEQPHRGFTVKF